MFGADEVDVAAQAEASLKVDAFSDCALCIVGYGPHDLQNGDATITRRQRRDQRRRLVEVQRRGEGRGATNDDGTFAVGDDQRLGHGDGYDVQPVAAARPAAGRRPAGASIPLPTDLTAITPKSNTDPCGTGAGHGPGVYGDVTLRQPGCILDPGSTS